jgi:hypothetical protein
VDGVGPILKAIHDGNWGDGASVVGVMISIIGFAVTIIGLARAKSAAAQTAVAVADVRQKLSLQNVLADLTALMSDVEEIKLLHRAGAWGAMPARYAAIRKRLLSVKATTTLTRAQKASLQAAIQ